MMPLVEAPPVSTSRSRRVGCGPDDDWRFVVPPHLLDGAARASGAAHTSVGQAVVVCDDATSHPIRQAIARCRPGGAVVVRVIRSRSRVRPLRNPWGLPLLRARLRRQGLVDVRAYWTAPTADACSHMVDLGDRAAVNLMLRRYHDVRFGRLRSLVARSFVRLGLTGSIARDLVVVGYRSGDADTAERPAFPAIPELRRVARSAGAAGGSTKPHTVLLTPRFPTSKHVIALLADGEDGEVTRVVKLGRGRDAARGLVREGQALRDLSQLSPALGGRIPAVIAQNSRGPFPRLVESAVAGLPLHPGAVRARPAEAVRLVVDFIDLLPVTAEGTDAQWYEQQLAQPLRRLVAAAGDDLPGVSTLAAQTLQLTEPVARLALPVVFEHGDLSHPNLVLVEPDVLGVVDWERAEPRGLVGHDLTFALQYLAEAERRAYTVAAQTRAFDEAFVRPDGRGRRAVADHLAARGVDPTLLPTLLVCCWARATLGLFDRLGATTDTVASPATGATAVLGASRELALWRRAAGHATQVGR